MTPGRPSASSVFGAAHDPVPGIQRTLASMGIPVRVTGVLDQQTVDAINGVFNGWDDAPPALRTGKLTQHDIARQIGLVSKLVKHAAGGALVFHDVNE